MEAGIAEDAELFGTLRLPRGGKHGYKGVRGRQGRERDQFQAYATVDNWKLTVPGLYGSAHEAAVALAQWRQQRELDLGEEPSAKRPRKKRSSKAEQLPAFDGAACCSELPPRWPLQPVCGLLPLPAAMARPLARITTPAVLLPQGVPAAAYRVPVVLGQLA